MESSIDFKHIQINLVIGDTLIDREYYDFINRALQMIKEMDVEQGGSRKWKNLRKKINKLLGDPANRKYVEELLESGHYWRLKSLAEQLHAKSKTPA